MRVCLALPWESLCSVGSSLDQHLSGRAIFLAIGYSATPPEQAGPERDRCCWLHSSASR